MDWHMIAYDLSCENGHTFEGWFENTRAYKQQQKKGLVSCPICNNTCVARIPSTFGIKSSTLPTSRPPVNPSLEKLGRQIYDFVDKNFDNVGSDFAKEALKIHYGASEPRNIRGVSTDQEEQTLRDEGVKFFKLPLPVEKDPNN